MTEGVDSKKKHINEKNEKDDWKNDEENCKSFQRCQIIFLQHSL